MSDRLVQLVWDRFPEGGAQLLALLAIGESCNEQGNCYCNVAALAASARMSRRSAQRAVNQLRDQMWVLTDRMLGRGGRLVYQLNLPLLTRSCRPGHDEAAMHTQRVRSTGETEAGLAERIRLRLPESQTGTATTAANLSPSNTESQSDTAPDRHSVAAAGPQNALEETRASRQEKQAPEIGESRGGRAEYEAAACLLLDDGYPIGGAADYYRGGAPLTPELAKVIVNQLRPAEDDFQGAGVPDAPHGALYGAPTASESPVLEGEAAYMNYCDDFSDEDYDELEALRVASERRQSRTLFVPRAGGR